MKEILLGILSSVFFAVTFILNRSMELSGGSWLWSSSLRFIFMFPLLFIILLLKRNLTAVIKEMLKQPFQWLIWSFMGFVLFYAPITYAAAYGPGWLVAGTWQLTIVAGTILSPLFYEKNPFNNSHLRVRSKIPMKSLSISLLILFGVAVIQYEKSNSLSIYEVMVGVFPVVIAAFAYPLGNRKMMEICGGKLDTFQRIFGMTFATLPFWIIIGIIGYIKAGPPPSNQIFQTFIVAICSGIIATTLFFIATNRVRGQQDKLAFVEATQSTQVLFVMIGEVFLFSAPLPSGITLWGLSIIIVGIVLHSYFSKQKTIRKINVQINENEKAI